MEATNTDLERAIERERDDEAYVAYAAWKRERGDPRGDLIAAQLAGEAKTPAGAKARKRANALLAEHADVFLGPLAGLPQDTHFGCLFTWRRGYIDSARIDCEGMVRATFTSVSVDTMAALDALLTHPSGRFLRSLTIRRVRREGNDYRPVVARLAGQELPMLQELELSPQQSMGRGESLVGDVAPLLAACRSLRVLRFGFVVVGVAFARIDLPSLVELEVMDPTKDAVQAIAAATWPALERLSLRFEPAAGVSLEDLRPVFAAEAMPRLTRLGLVAFRAPGEGEGADALCEALAESPLADRLVDVDLSLGDMTDRGATALAAGRLQRLEKVEVGYNYIGKAGKRALAGRGWKAGQQYKP